ncbi:hypothetical protein ANSO36C_56790 [Nostoc cf. commune SO-36]|uniref:Uncharacterized protein n=1 Tax=Nostoc cf. commune SO-36 TaxID=449208 RepID=A0ABM7Z9G4_NOSCO|nr:hypothetical protein ANSO36C_56790 [Nostoc cf. commune SO-36]
MIKSVLYFLWASLFEIGGGYLIWLWLREGKPFWWGILGGIAKELKYSRFKTPPMKGWSILTPDSCLYFF